MESLIDNRVVEYFFIVVSSATTTKNTSVSILRCFVEAQHRLVQDDTRLLLLRLCEIEFDRCFAVEDEDHDRDLSFVNIHRVDRSLVVLERSIDDDDEVTNLEVALELGFLLSDTAFDHAVLFGRNGDGDIARADESRDVWCVPDQVPTLVRHDHVYKDVSGEELLLFLDGITLLEGQLLLLGDLDIKDKLTHPKRLNTLEEGFAYSVFVSGVRMNDVPISTRIGVLFDILRHSDFR